MRATALAALSAVLLACGASSAPPSAGLEPSGPATGARTGPVISPPPVTPPTPPGDNLPAFACADASGGSPGSTPAVVTAVRVGQDTGWDRFVLQFDSRVPSYTVKRQTKPVFNQGASGQTMTLLGTAGVLVTVHSASESGSYSGPIDFSPAGYPVLKEARLTEDFEGTVSWGLGLSAMVCIRAFTLNDPARLVVDLQSS